MGAGICRSRNQAKESAGKWRRACPDEELLAVGIAVVIYDGAKNTSMPKRWKEEASFSLCI